jgi:predicted RNA-binding protein YlxR (DUF448 family)
MSDGHVPIRTCLGCRQRKPKQELLRVAPGPAGLKARAEGGRGRYVCRDASCITRTLKRKDIGSLIGEPVTDEKLQAMVSSLLGENALDDTHPERGIRRGRSGGGVVG